MSQPQSAESSGGGGGSTFQFTEEVMRHMRSCGDHRVLLECRAQKMALPPSKPGSLPPSCALLIPQTQVYLAIAQRSVYLFPDERIPTDRIGDIVVHTYCSCPENVMELGVPAESGKVDKRFISFPSKALLKQVVNALRSVAGDSRLMFHESCWPQRDDDKDEKMLPAMNHKLQAFHRRRQLIKQNQPKATTQVSSFGPGRFGEAAESLADELREMIDEVDGFLDYPTTTDWAAEQERKDQMRLEKQSSVGGYVEPN